MNIAARLEKLEAKTGEPLVVILRSFAGGRLIGDFTVGCIGRGTFFLVGSSIAEGYYLRWFERQRGDLRVTVRSLLGHQVGLAVAGPRSRELLARLVRQDLSSTAFPFLDIRRLDIGMVPCLVGRISFTGELGYELWTEPDHQRTLYDSLKSVWTKA